MPLPLLLCVLLAPSIGGETVNIDQYKALIVDMHNDIRREPEASDMEFLVRMHCF